MARIKVAKRDIYLLVIGVLLAFFIQIVYEILNELSNGTSLFEFQIILAIMIGVVLFVLLGNIEESKKQKWEILPNS
jgi:hypothetical protein